MVRNGFMRTLHDGNEPVCGKQFHQKVERAQPHRFDRACNRSVCGGDDERMPFNQIGMRAHQVQAVHIGQLQVRQDRADAIERAREQVHGFCAGADSPA